MSRPLERPIRAAGGLVWRPCHAGREVVVIHRPKYDDWSFPKGKLDRGETLEQTALREVFEETALHCVLGHPLGMKAYPEKRKEVHYWTMTVREQTPFLPNDEVDEMIWVSPHMASMILSHAQDYELLLDFQHIAERLDPEAGR